MTLIPIFASSDTSWRLELDGKVYRVTRSTWRSGRWRQGGERWAVFAAQGIHQATRECDPAKPTHRRVVAAVPAALSPIAI